MEKLEWNGESNETMEDTTKVELLKVLKEEMTRMQLQNAELGRLVKKKHQRCRHQQFYRPFTEKPC